MNMHSGVNIRGGLAGRGAMMGSGQGLPSPGGRGGYSGGGPPQPILEPPAKKPATDSSKESLEESGYLQDHEGHFPNEYWCKTCNAKTTGPDNFQQHMRGIRHQNNVKNLALGGGEWTKWRKEPSSIAREQKMILDQHQNLTLTTGPQTPRKKTKRVHDEEGTKRLLADCLQDVTEPVIGLEYVTEIIRKDTDVDPDYECEICSCRTLYGNILFHLIGFRHRQAYILKHKPEVMEGIRKVVEEEEKAAGEPELLAEDNGKSKEEIEAKREHNRRKKMSDKLKEMIPSIIGDLPSGKHKIKEVEMSSNTGGFINKKGNVSVAVPEGQQGRGGPMGGRGGPMGGRGGPMGGRGGPMGGRGGPMGGRGGPMGGRGGPMGGRGGSTGGRGGPAGSRGSFTGGRGGSTGGRGSSMGGRGGTTGGRGSSTGGRGGNLGGRGGNLGGYGSTTGGRGGPIGRGGGGFGGAMASRGGGRGGGYGPTSRYSGSTSGYGGSMGGRSGGSMGSLTSDFASRYDDYTGGYADDDYMDSLYDERGTAVRSRTGFGRSALGGENGGRAGSGGYGSLGSTLGRSGYDVKPGGSLRAGSLQQDSGYGPLPPTTGLYKEKPLGGGGGSSGGYGPRGRDQRVGLLDNPDLGGGYSLPPPKSVSDLDVMKAGLDDYLMETLKGDSIVSDAFILREFKRRFGTDTAEMFPPEQKPSSDYGSKPTFDHGRSRSGGGLPRGIDAMPYRRLESTPDLVTEPEYTSQSRSRQGILKTPPDEPTAQHKLKSILKNSSAVHNPQEDRQFGGIGGINATGRDIVPPPTPAYYLENYPDYPEDPRDGFLGNKAGPDVRVPQGVPSGADKMPSYPGPNPSAKGYLPAKESGTGTAHAYGRNKPDSHDYSGGEPEYNDYPLPDQEYSHYSGDEAEYTVYPEEYINYPRTRAGGGVTGESRGVVSPPPSSVLLPTPRDDPISGPNYPRESWHASESGESTTSRNLGGGSLVQTTDPSSGFLQQQGPGSESWGLGGSGGIVSQTPLAWPSTAVTPSSQSGGPSMYSALTRQGSEYRESHTLVGNLSDQLRLSSNVANAPLISTGVKTTLPGQGDNRFDSALDLPPLPAYPPPVPPPLPSYNGPSGFTRF